MNLKTIKLEKVFINDKKSDGTPFVNKNGGKYEMAVIYWEGKSASCYLDAKFGEKKKEIISKWTQGSTVSVKIEQNGSYLNFDIPSKLDLLEERVDNMSEFIKSKFPKDFE